MKKHHKVMLAALLAASVSIGLTPTVAHAQVDPTVVTSYDDKKELWLSGRDASQGLPASADTMAQWAANRGVKRLFLATGNDVNNGQNPAADSYRGILSDGAHARGLELYALLDGSACLGTLLSTATYQSLVSQALSTGDYDGVIVDFESWPCYTTSVSINGYNGVTAVAAVKQALQAVKTSVQAYSGKKLEATLVPV